MCRNDPEVTESVNTINGPWCPLLPMELIDRLIKKGRYRLVDGEWEKFCPRCSDWWPADTEFFHPFKPYGLQYVCKACEAEMAGRDSASKAMVRMQQHAA